MGSTLTLFRGPSKFLCLSHLAPLPSGPATPVSPASPDYKHVPRPIRTVGRRGESGTGSAASDSDKEVVDTTLDLSPIPTEAKKIAPPPPFLDDLKVNVIHGFINMAVDLLPGGTFASLRKGLFDQFRE